MAALVPVLLRDIIHNCVNANVEQVVNYGNPRKLGAAECTQPLLELDKGSVTVSPYFLG